MSRKLTGLGQAASEQVKCQLAYDDGTWAHLSNSSIRFYRLSFSCYTRMHTQQI